MQDSHPQPAPNYTNACLVMFGVNLMWIFTVLWAIWGFILVLVIGWAINRIITLFALRADARAAADRTRGRSFT